ncbi:citryl-CoA lyase [Streptomyces sp. NPDC057623]|uniref:citryl-CoA lyase n=1 Tax=Streptomyces sp. NPDC057623 TaxID=3346187 RepID=UPI00368915F5
MARSTHMKTSMAEVTPDRIVVRGLDLADELIGRTTTAEFFYVLLTGSRPSATQARILDACIVAIGEHGLVPSVQAARMTYACAPEAFQGAVAAGLLGAGSVVLGSSEATARVLKQIVDLAADDDLDGAAKSVLQQLKDQGAAAPGVGHPVHKAGDPRAARLLEFTESLGAQGVHTSALHAMTRAVPLVYGRELPLNVSGAIPAALLDVGFPLRAMKGVPLVGRTMSLVAHLLEEMDSPMGFGLASAAEAAVTYEP